MIQVILDSDFTIMVGDQYVMSKSDDTDMVSVAQNIVDAFRAYGVPVELVVEG